MTTTLKKPTTMKTKHTQGEWRIEQNHVGNFSIVTKSEHIGVIYNNLENGVSSYEAEANAQLIAAAPELLEALKLMAEEFVPYEGSMRESEMNEAYEKAKRAINKATE